MKIAALIPARLESTRFPGKLLQKIGGKSIILHVHDNMKATGLFDHVGVVCNHIDIYSEITQNGGIAYMSKYDHENGTSRISEIAKTLDFPIIFNVQGDEPFVQSSILRSLIDIFKEDVTEEIDIVSPMTLITEDAQIVNPNIVKVVTTSKGEALYFSRSPIPYRRNEQSKKIFYRHIGIYGYRASALNKIDLLPNSILEDQEMIECLRYLEHGMKIKMAITESQGVSIDTPEDLEKAIKYYQQLQSK
jgi:3-deoxy-manno-octulosonate cytidylyltransferase (CMP-KDO synthetase)